MDPDEACCPRTHIRQQMPGGQSDRLQLPNANKTLSIKMVPSRMTDRFLGIAEAWVACWTRLDFKPGRLLQLARHIYLCSIHQLNEESPTQNIQPTCLKIVIMFLCCPETVRAIILVPASSKTPSVRFSQVWLKVAHGLLCLSVRHGATNQQSKQGLAQLEIWASSVTTLN